jgi:hypothetical protein
VQYHAAAVTVLPVARQKEKNVMWWPLSLTIILNLVKICKRYPTLKGETNKYKQRGDLIRLFSTIKKLTRLRI